MKVAMEYALNAEYPDPEDVNLHVYA
jgi:hypothetical protein